MAWHIGVTTDLEGRWEYWHGVHPDLINWQVLGHYYCQEDAKAEEERLLKHFDCVAHPRVEEPENPYGAWYVYSFNTKPRTGSGVQGRNHVDHLPG